MEFLADSIDLWTIIADTKMSIESHDYVPMGNTQGQKQEALTQIQKQDVLQAEKPGTEQLSTNEIFSKLIEEQRFTNANICPGLSFRRLDPLKSESVPVQLSPIPASSLPPDSGRNRPCHNNLSVS
ncbi:unnamed protein product [Adineta ricciae]|uniref:Uncharacterized protein n=1 Tax=Adineta ricciae TaxID=249248 RepID=A0A814QID4_ADIRI|nr:unnamed protein product [Adineta ricciae]